MLSLFIPLLALPRPSLDIPVPVNTIDLVKVNVAIAMDRLERHSKLGRKESATSSLRAWAFLLRSPLAVLLAPFGNAFDVTGCLALAPLETSLVHTCNGGFGLCGANVAWFFTPYGANGCFNDWHHIALPSLWVYLWLVFMCKTCWDIVMGRNTGCILACGANFWFATLQPSLWISKPWKRFCVTFCVVCCVSFGAKCCAKRWGATCQRVNA